MEHHVVLDLEFDQPGKEVIEIGACAVAASATGAQILKTFSIFVHPGHPNPLDGYVKRLTGITDDDVKGAVSEEEAFAKFASWLSEFEGQFQISSWGREDINWFWNQWCSSGRQPGVFSVCELKYRHAAARGQPKHHLGLDKALSAAGRWFQGTRHRALPDAINTAELIPVILQMEAVGKCPP